jgi:ssDNA-binding Zn-finger/Zn-ribbon topoisomerase 1
MNTKKLNSILIVLSLLSLGVCALGFFSIDDIFLNKNEYTYIERCPICGRNVDLIENNDGTYYIYCEINDMEGGCGLRTGLYDDKTILVTVWNELCKACHK